MVEEEEELTHSGGESDLCGLTAGAQLLVESTEKGIGTDGTEGGHVDGTTQAVAAAGDVALTLELTAIVVERSDAEERGGLAAGEGAQFGTEGQSGGGREETYPFDLSEPSGLRGERLFLSQSGGESGLQLGNVAGEQRDARALEGDNEDDAVMGGLDEQGTAFEHGLLAGDDEFLESHLGGARRQIRLGLCQAPEIVERLCIDRIGLRPAAQAVGKVAHLTWIGDAQGDARRVGRGDERAVARAGGFANQMSAWRQFG